MGERLTQPTLQQRLGYLSEELGELLEGRQPQQDEFDNLNIADKAIAKNGTAHLVATSVRPDGSRRHHLQFRAAVDDEGYEESWSFLWGDREPTVVHVRRQEQYDASSAQPQNEKREVRSLDLNDAEGMMRVVLDSYLFYRPAR